VPGAFAGPIYTPDELGVDIDPETGELRDVIAGTATETPPPALPASTVEAAAVAASAPLVVPPREPEPEPDIANRGVQSSDALTTEQLRLLRELLVRVEADDTAKRMYLLAAGVTLAADEDPESAMARLTVGQARDVMHRATESRTRTESRAS
jgi:hypothetical protein